MDDGVTKYHEGNVYHGDRFTAPANPSKAEDAGYSYVFEKWIPLGDFSLEMLDSVPHDLVFKAQFSAVAHNYSVKSIHVDNTGAIDLSSHNTSKTYAVQVEEYDVPQALTSPELPADYKLISSEVEGSAGKDSTITYTFTYAPKDSVSIMVNYYLYYEAGNETDIVILPQATRTGKEGEAYNISDLIYKPTTGSDNQYTYVSDNTIIEGSTEGVYTGNLGTTDKVVNVYYSLNSYEFKVMYYRDSISEDNRLDSPGETIVEEAPYGFVLTKEYVAQLLENEDWVNALRPSGYNAGTPSYPTISADLEKNVICVLYTKTSTPPPVYSYYNITINYLEELTNEVLDTKYVNSSMLDGSSYNVTDLANKEIDGYILTTIDGSVTGNLRGNVVINVYYSESIDIEDEDVPLVENPEQPEQTDTPADPEDVVEIEEETTPLGDAPDTGDSANLALMIALAISSLGGTYIAAFNAIKTSYKKLLYTRSTYNVQDTKKALSFILIFVMIFSSMSSLSAYADTNPGSDWQVKKDDSNSIVYHTLSTDGEITNQGTTIGNSTSGGKVLVKKAISPTSDENIFDMRLTVETKQEIKTETIFPDAAVVLVMDISYSMNGSSLKNAKAAAKSFLAEFASSSNGAARHVTIVAFHTSARYIVEDWTNATDLNWSQGADSSNSLTDAINTLSVANNSSDYYTNIHHGLMLARDKVLELPNDVSEENTFVVLLTDGAPNRYIDDDGKVESASSNRNGHYTRPPLVAKQITDLGAKLYSISYGADDDKIDNSG